MIIVSPKMAEYLRRNICDYCGGMEKVRTFIDRRGELPEIHMCETCWWAGTEIKHINYVETQEQAG